MNAAVHNTPFAGHPRVATVDDVRRALENTVAGSHGHGLHEARLAAARHLATGGQRLRARLCLDTALGLDVPSQQAVQLAVACELAHNASLVHDDICDRAAERRGAPSVWALYGTGGALCTGDWLLCAAFGALAEHMPTRRVPALLALFSRRTRSTVEGQMAELEAARSEASPGLGAYARMAVAKSAPLFALALEAPLVLAGRDDLCRRAHRAARALALGYQLLDDADDAAEPAVEGVNAVRVLTASGCTPRTARRRVRQLARRRLTRASEAAAGLPEPVAAPLQACCDALAPPHRQAAEAPA